MKICPKCGSRMDEGFILEGDQNGARASRWVDGAPEKSFWTGLKLKGRAKLPITSFRCVRCGYLENYALV